MRPLSERLQIPLLILLADICIGFGICYWTNLTDCEAALQPNLICFFILNFAFMISNDVLKAPDLPHAYRKWLISLKYLLLFLLISSMTKSLKIADELSSKCNGVSVFPLDTKGYILSLLQTGWSSIHLKQEGQGNFSFSQWLSEKIGLFTIEKEKLTREFSQPFNGSQEGLCPICLADFQNGEQIIALPKCSHAFHSECVFPWLSKTPVCPFCRRNIRSALYNFGD